jgi:MAF protein
MALLGIPFEVWVPQVDERPRPAEIPAELPQRISRLKAQWVARQVKDAIVVAADTVVVHKGVILGKPRDAVHACEMLRRLRGERHLVLSGVAVLDTASGKAVYELCETIVWLRDVDDDEIEAYVSSGDPLDKAAAYAIQNPEFRLVSRVIGCPANVMGLPLCHVVQSLRRLSVILPPSPAVRCEMRYGYKCALAECVMPGLG